MQHCAISDGYISLNISSLKIRETLNTGINLFLLSLISPHNQENNIDLVYSTGYGDCSTHTRVQCVQYGGFTRQLHAQCARVKFYTQCYTHPNYTQYLRVFY